LPYWIKRENFWPAGDTLTDAITFCNDAQLICFDVTHKLVLAMVCAGLGPFFFDVVVIFACHAGFDFACEKIITFCSAFV